MHLAFAFLLGILAIGLVQSAWQRGLLASRPTVLVEGPPPAPPAPTRLDLNQAGVAELQQLPGLGPQLALRIVLHREANGPFRTVEELQHVAGIGPLAVERVRPHLYVSRSTAGTLDPAPEMHEPPTKRGSSPTLSGSRKALPATPIDLNRASRDELMKLPGIGPAMADRILADRAANGPYRRVSDLTRIKGIKGKTLEKLRPHVHVEEPPSVAQGASAG